MGPTRHLPLKNDLIPYYFKIEETTKNLNQVDRPRDLNPGLPECESRELPRNHLARFYYIIEYLIEKQSQL